MTRKLLALAVCGLAIGCTPESLLTPTIPAVPPAKANESKSEPARVKAPVTPTSITSQNAQEKLAELEAELELDAKTPNFKP